MSAGCNSSLRLGLFSLTDGVLEVILKFLLELFVFARFHNNGLVVDFFDNVYVGVVIVDLDKNGLDRWVTLDENACFVSIPLINHISDNPPGVARAMIFKSLLLEIVVLQRKLSTHAGGCIMTHYNYCA